MNGHHNTAAHIPPMGILMLVMLSFLWGGNMVSIKVSNQGIPPMMAAAVRSVVASILLWWYARVKGEPVFLSGGDFKHGVIIGLIFGLEFLLLYSGLSLTDASRGVIFLYTHPFWVALAAHYLLHGDRLTWSKSIGLSIAFAGVALVFGFRSSTAGPLSWLGDLMELGAALGWAATTVYIKQFISYRPISHFQTLFAQLFFSIPVLAVGAAIFESGQPVTLAPMVLAAVFYQSVIVAFMSYLLWFWMIHHYQVSRLAAFTFLAPMFGVLLSGLFLHETLTVYLIAGLVMVAAGIYLVNRPETGLSWYGRS
jgi:drug/metabolite transporter (DMT)-like permease